MGPGSSCRCPRCSSRLPACTGQITRGLRCLARELSEKASSDVESRKPVPLWVTGHSLGAALAGLIYARYLTKSADLGTHIVLRDAYTFGGELLRPLLSHTSLKPHPVAAPRLGDGAFVSKYEEVSSAPAPQLDLADLLSFGAGFQHPHRPSQHSLARRQRLRHCHSHSSVSF